MSINYHTLVIDDFFDDPDYVRNLGLKHSQNVDKLSSTGYYRGKRSKNLSIIDKFLYKKIVTTLAQSYLQDKFNINFYESIRCNSHFQLTDKTWKEGWVHHDSCHVTSIIYLNPISPPNTGTNLYVAKRSNTTQLHSIFHKETNFSSELRNTNEYVKKLQENNSQFIETISIQNQYNRLISFHGCQWHCGANHFGNTDETSRLTIATFIYDFGKSLIN